MLHQGLQRRFAVTIIHEARESASPPVEFVDLPKVVVGRARDTPEFHFTDAHTRIFSLSVFPTHYLPPAGDDRTFYRFEAAWDSSLHGCGFLNRVTPKGHTVYVTMSCYVQLSCSLDPICITKDFAMIIFPRSSTITVPSSVEFLSQRAQFACHPHMVAKYTKTEARHTPRHMLNSTYVRGEENIRGWRPRSDSLIVEHQMKLERLAFIESVEKTKQFLALREAIKAKKRDDLLQRLDKMIRQLQRNRWYDLLSHFKRPTSSNQSLLDENPDTTSLKGVARPNSLSTNKSTFINSDKKSLLLTCVNILGFSNLQPRIVRQSWGLHLKPVSPLSPLLDAYMPKVNADSVFLQCGELQNDMLCARCDEVRISPVVNRRGLLLVADESNPNWVPRWIMVRRPFLYIYENEKDTLERRIINLKVAHLEYSAEEGEIFGPKKTSPERSKVVEPTKHPMIFALQYADRKIFMKTGPSASRNEIHEWLYAIDPLMAGEINLVLTSLLDQPPELATTLTSVP
ncbi:Kinesin-like protein unc-104 [Echinococcus granulosus]|uniref:Kinesin-like protein unc-104 n=1 Tax=Echinococcus granulosus TaxID=6210 RepID=W6UIA3_ECHGR|nr:Kinesin-like protein unc-104 [Echinococcus granulosus]EUB57832.1 Kinesin-like protein unc-104 [Echinococcus granulosus]